MWAAQHLAIQLTEVEYRSGNVVSSSDDDDSDEDASDEDASDDDSSDEEYESDDDSSDDSSDEEYWFKNESDVGKVVDDVEEGEQHRRDETPSYEKRKENEHNYSPTSPLSPSGARFNKLKEAVHVLLSSSDDDDSDDDDSDDDDSDEDDSDDDDSDEEYWFKNESDVGEVVYDVNKLWERADASLKSVLRKEALHVLLQEK